MIEGFVCGLLSKEKSGAPYRYESVDRRVAKSEIDANENEERQ
jgi:hypothetical protein